MKRSVILILIFLSCFSFAFELQLLSIDERTMDKPFAAGNSDQIVWFADNDDLLCAFYGGSVFYKQGMKEWFLVGDSSILPGGGDATSLYQVKGTEQAGVYMCNERVFRPTGRRSFFIVYENATWKMKDAVDINFEIQGELDVGRLGVELPDTARGYGRENERVIPLDFGYYIHLATARTAENDEASLLFRDRNKNVVIDYDTWRENYNEVKTIDSTRHRYESYTYKINCVAVNHRKNRVAAVVNWYNGDKDGLLVFAITYNGVINDGRVRLRVKPEIDSEVLGFLDAGDLVKIVDRSPEKKGIGIFNDYWYKVQIAGFPVGWVYGAYITVK